MYVKFQFLYITTDVVKQNVNGRGPLVIVVRLTSVPWVRYGAWELDVRSCFDGVSL